MKTQPKSFVLMTALPPTEGHIRLIKFAQALTSEVIVIVSTQPDEPYCRERVTSLSAALPYNVIYNHHEQVQQVPNGDYDHAFWKMWRSKLESYGFQPGDYIVSSELYGVKLAEVCGGVFMPYDLERWTYPCTAESVREDPFTNFHKIIPQFQRHLRKRVTIFGAESAGKTTLTKRLKKLAPDYVTITAEWARPYLEAVGSELTVEKMKAIHLGQRALQETAWREARTPFLVQDTDLFSTIGYWNNWDMWSVPNGIEEDALDLKSDLYIIPRSDLIPFEPDPLRYGGDKRELSDEYWISLCEHYHLNYVVLDDASAIRRESQAFRFMDEIIDRKLHNYTRVR